MATSEPDFTVGVEEEFLVIDAASRRLRRPADAVVSRAREAVGDQVHPELQRSQVETGTAVCHSLAELRAEVVRLRREVISAAESHGCVVAAAGTHPFSDWRREHEVTPEAPYVRLEQDYQQLTREQMVCGCHVHVGVSDREAAIQVMNHVRPWLSPILALTVNSPFWMGADTGYASFRTQLWRRWPMDGLPHAFESRAEYDALVETLLRTGSIDAPGRIYWDVRPSHRFSTLEFRGMDACLSVDETVMMAGLARAMARTCHADVVRGVPVPLPRPELLRAAAWRAARYGLEADLVDVRRGVAVPAAELVETLLAFLRPDLEENGEWDEVSRLVGETAARGTGASRQRQAFARSGRLEDVVDLIVAETARVQGER